MKSAARAMELSLDVLGAALVQPEVLSDLRVPPADMPDARSGWVLEAMQALHARGDRIELRGVRAELERLQRTVDHDYLAQLAERASPVSLAVIDALHREAELRRIGALTRRVQAACDDGDLEAARELHAELAGTETGYGTDATRLRDMAVRAASSVVQAARAGNPPGLPFGMPWLDRALGTLRRGNMLTIGAPTNTGKSRFVMAMLLGMSRHAPVGWISCEDAEDLIGERYAGIESGVRSLDMRRGLHRDHAEMLAAKMASFGDPDIWVDVLIGKREVDVLASMRKMAHAHGVKHFVIDYVQAIRSSQTRADKRHQISDMAAQFKGLAHSLGCSLTIVSQVVRPSRDAIHRPPTMHDLKESGDLENASESIVILWPDVDPGTKQRTGRVNARVVKGKVEIGDDSAVFGSGSNGLLRELINVSVR